MGLLRHSCLLSCCIFDCSSVKETAGCLALPGGDDFAQSGSARLCMDQYVFLELLAKDKRTKAVAFPHQEALVPRPE